MNGQWINGTVSALALAFLATACSPQEKPSDNPGIPARIGVRDCIRLANEQSETAINARYEAQFATRDDISRMSPDEREHSFIRELTLRDQMQEEIFSAHVENARTCKSGDHPVLTITRAP
ncbi:MAG: hypothetical protein HYS17_05505 [Micavibrio aeruginosavorus]|uniref:Uncharacterized protein n=1 Tax=Micavibrio aeruginosavorus TaxID=349221 RepID=A0A7T5UJ02_9BACT|nr:MAG: hypothetical protein HYS17_05505 [Micavibrio aeruginosavorus]